MEVVLMDGVQLEEQPQPTPGPWRPSKCGGGVIADSPISTHSSDSNVEYYGGFLVCESVLKGNLSLLVAAPLLLQACEAVLGGRLSITRLWRRCGLRSLRRKPLLSSTTDGDCRKFLADGCREKSSPWRIR